MINASQAMQFARRDRDRAGGELGKLNLPLTGFVFPEIPEEPEICYRVLRIV